MKDNRLPMVNGDFVLVESLEKTKQHIVSAIRTMYGDWLLNYLKGIDFVPGLRNEVFLDHDMKQQITGVETVTGITNYVRTFDRKTLTVQITAVVQTIYGDIPISEVIKK